jgi:raffinose/stachyose/melibiose transport system permease protein
LGILPGILVFVFISLIPSIATAALSFTDISGIPGAKWKFIGLANYREFFFLQNGRDTALYFLNTFKFTVFVSVIQMILSLLIALLLNSKVIKFTTFSRAVVFLPQVLGVTLVGLAWTAVLNPMDGPMQVLFGLFGANSSFLADWDYAINWVIIIQIWLGMGFSTVIFIAGLQNIPGELYEAGVMDGATGTQAFRSITLPLIWPQVTVNAVICVIGTLTNFQTFYVTTYGDFNTMTLGMKMFMTAFGGGKNSLQGGAGSFLRQGYAASVAMVLFVIVLLFTVLTQYGFSKKEEEI